MSVTRRVAAAGRLVLALLAASALPLWAMRGGTDEGPSLASFLALQRRVYAGAEVSGRFYDWRSVSRYRAQAGLHYGYDIAMPAGTRVVTAWPGQVTAIAVWYGQEHGITVVSPSGYAITFGHLQPRVRVGDVLNPGDVVGEVVVDHVDIKMRGPDGAYFDFGHDTPMAGAPWLKPFPAAPVHTARERLLALQGGAWVQREMGRARAALETARASARGARAQYDDGVLSRLEAAEVEAGAAAVERRLQWLQRVERRLRDDPRLQQVRQTADPSRTAPDADAVRRAIEATVPPPASPAQARPPEPLEEEVLSREERGR